MRTLKWMVMSILILAACNMPPSLPRDLIPAKTFIGADKQQFYFMYESGALRDHLKSGQLGSPKIRPVKRPVWRGCHDCRRVAAPQVDK
jgi:hypothetical protein